MAVRATAKAVARGLPIKERTMKFSEVIGQEAAKERLVQMETEGRVPHALLICGPSGCGKMALAMAFASYLLGEREAADDTENFMAAPVAPAAGNAEAMLRKWEHPDLHFTYPTIKPTGWPSERQPVSDDFAKEWRQLICGGAYFTMDQWMTAMNAANQQAIITGKESDELSRKLALKSSQGGYKISIIWQPERMNATSANKLLKLLEEPPQQTVFIMVSEEPEKLLETIRSRTQRIDVRRIDTTAIEQALVSRRAIDADTARRFARVANGSWLKALEELDMGSESQQFLDLFIMLMRLAYMRKIADLKKWSENVAAFGREKQKRMLTYFLHMVRENFMYNFGNPELVYMTQDEENFARNFARYINERNVVEIADLISLCIRDIGQNANSKIVFFDMTVKMIVLLIK